MADVTISERGQFVCRIRFGENFISFVNYDEIVVYITDVVGINKLIVRNMNTYRVYSGVPLKPMIKVFSEHHITEASNSEAYSEPYQTLKRNVLQKYLKTLPNASSYDIQ